MFVTVQTAMSRRPCDGLFRRCFAHSSHHEHGVAHKERPVLLANVPLNHKTNWERMELILFETLDVPLMFVTIQMAMPLFGSRRTTGIGMDTRDVGSQKVPITEAPFAITTYLNLNRRAAQVISSLIESIRFDEGPIVNAAIYQTHSMPVTFIDNLKGWIGTDVDSVTCCACLP